METETPSLYHLSHIRLFVQDNKNNNKSSKTKKIVQINLSHLATGLLFCPSKCNTWGQKTESLANYDPERLKAHTLMADNLAPLMRLEAMLG